MNELLCRIIVWFWSTVALRFVYQWLFWGVYISYPVNSLLSFIFSILCFQAANPNKVSDDLIESFRDDFRAGRSVNSGGKTLEDFCRDSNFDVRKTRILRNSLVTFSVKPLVEACVLRRNPLVNREILVFCLKTLYQNNFRCCEVLFTFS